MKRNKLRMFYRTPLTMDAIVDADGYATGEKRLSMSDPVPVEIVLYSPTGKILREHPGMLGDYTFVALVDDPNCGMSEGAKLYETEYSAAPTYLIRAKLPSLNSVVYELKKVCS